MKIAVCDDCLADCDNLTSLVAEYCKTHHIDCESASFTSGERLLMSNLDEYDIVFLDVQMPKLNGIEIARRIRTQNQHLLIVFVTSFVDYGPQGYEVDAFRYILKESMNVTLPTCLDDYRNKTNMADRRFRFKFVEGNISLPLKDIIYVESDRHKLCFFVTGRAMPYTMYRKLDEVEITLQNSTFLRIHKSYLVNLRHVLTHRRYHVEMSNGISLAIPKNNFKKINEQIILFLGDYL